jgi:hypothetical protein
MTDLIHCAVCKRGFLVPPAPCPECGAPAPDAAAAGTASGSGSRRERDIIVSSRLNQTAQVGGVLIAGLLTGALSWFLVSREMGVGMLLLALLVSAALLWRR